MEEEFPGTNDRSQKPAKHAWEPDGPVITLDKGSGKVLVDYVPNHITRSDRSLQILGTEKFACIQSHPISLAHQIPSDQENISTMECVWKESVCTSMVSTTAFLRIF